MNKTRLEAFSDGVLAIIITIMILEIKVPQGHEFADLKPLIAKFLSYILSFVYVGIYWNNHHYLIHGMTKINGKILWANLHLLFWLSLIPLATGWMGEHNFAKASMTLYGVILFLSSVAYFILQRIIIVNEGENSVLAKAIGRDLKGYVSSVLYILGIVFSFYSEWVSGAAYFIVALLWLIPDKRIEKVFASKN
ncbi:TMEM175 family protein [Flavobacterium sp. AC]|uniref:TMEM175 family protein n=1 Tax=Flavobacterium azizsancarii TaxID=2961580 RepID=A0ABT4WGV1_9FLAO|nr:TMEM175 family protein [Flavobacterium azizsancarii]MDA6071820.1 TMEM175 family protein [Flavobacterium azizsancarii]